MPRGGNGGPAGGYHAGPKGSYGCKGYPTVSADGTVHGCHPTKAAAAEQARAIFASISREAKKASEATWVGFFYPETTKAVPGLSETPTPQDEMEDPSAQDCECGEDSCEKCKTKKIDMPEPITIPSDNVETVSKKDYSPKARERMATEGQAMPDGSFPIANSADLHNAIQSVGRAKDYAAAKQHIVRRARALGLTAELPEDWKKSVAKSNWSGSIFDLKPFTK